jgi:methionyl-tRNA formyltransferase
VRIVFLGTAEFAVPSLRRSAERGDVVAVVTQPDKPGSRGRPAPRPVAATAAELGIAVLAPRRIRDASAVDELRALRPDVVVVAAYGQILSQALLDVPPLGAVNVHASLLPRWRGASPVAHTILAGDAESGVTILKMDAGLDTGPIYAQRRLPLRDDTTTPALTATLAELGADALGEVLARLECGEAKATPQPAEGVTLAPRLSRQDGEVHWGECSAVDVDRRVRALNPWPGVTAAIAGTPVRVLSGAVARATIAREDAAPDPVVRDDMTALPSGARPGDVLRLDGESALIGTRDGAYRVERVLPPGSRPMSAAAFLRGRRTVR